MNRKRKSVTVIQDMSKGGSGSKKKKSSPSKQASHPKPTANKAMPGLPRTPQAGAEPQAEPAAKKEVPDVASLLMAMEARITSKLDATKKAVNEAVSLSKLNSDALDALKEKVDANDEILRETLARVEKQEERVLAKVESQVREMVRDQLKAAGFDSQLSAGDLSTITDSTTYAEALAANRSDGRVDRLVLRPSKEERQEAKFWECRRTLRLWPVTDPTAQGIKEKLSMDDAFIEEDMGNVLVKRSLDKRSKNKKEVVAVFENKQIRDAIKAQGPSLANYRDKAGMQLQIPDHLQKDFQSLISVAYDLKRKNPELKRNVKFDEERLGLFMNFQMSEGSQWRRIWPDQARKALNARPERTNDMAVEDEEIMTLLGEADK